MKYCKFCGTEIPDGEVCHCAEAQNEALSATKTQNKNSMAGAFIAIIAGVIIIFVLLINTFSGGYDKPVDQFFKGIEKCSVSTMAKSFPEDVSYSLKDSVSTARLIWISLGDLLKGKYGADEISGPVGTISVIGQASETGANVREKVMSLLNLTIFITINIGIFNLLPIPALDGGRLVFLLIEAVRRKPIKPEYEAYVHAVGMLLLFGLMIFATYNDIIRLKG